MPWTIRVTLDKDKPDVGQVSATYTQAGETFTHSDRIKVTPAARDAFVAEAVAARDIALAKIVSQNGYVANVEAAFVAAGEEIAEVIA